MLFMLWFLIHLLVFHNSSSVLIMNFADFSICSGGLLMLDAAFNGHGSLHSNTISTDTSAFGRVIHGPAYTRIILKLWENRIQ